MPYHAYMEIIRTRTYERKANKLLNEIEATTAEDEICRAPQKWPLISGMAGIRKARAARGASGKSGGVRIIYYYWLNEETVYLLDIYAKNEKENLSASEKKVLRELFIGLTGGKHG